MYNYIDYLTYEYWGWCSVPPLTSVARLRLARADAITGPPLEPAPQKQLKSSSKAQKKSKHPWSRPKRGGAGHPTSVAQIGVGGLWGGGSSGTGGGLLRLIPLLRFVLLSKLVGSASVVCVPVSTVHRSSRPPVLIIDYYQK
jgi:hypothetical protein